MVTQVETDKPFFEKRMLFLLINQMRYEHAREKHQDKANDKNNVHYQLI